MFENRIDAGKKLAKALEGYRDRDPLVLAIPRGGALVGYEVAKHLNARFSLIIARKLPFPDNPESGFGAIAEDGSTFLFKAASGWLSESAIREVIRRQKIELQRRIDVLRRGKALPEVKGKVVILVDDGIAMGSTMRASIMLCRNRKAKKIIVAAPVAGPDVAEEIRRMADEAVILEKPAFFQAVAQVYRNWYDLTDEEVLEVMDRWEK
ncbi:MAG: phosphoribosyltransferase family protein [Candidatus Aureabacteria bacterium]|nr:phosphoribosyltransferase family protein [Candidatus Auribacterota bacterium]